MPGAPNRPPENAPEARAAPPPEPPEARALRRLAPSRVALLLDLWKGAPSADLLVPYDKAEAAFSAGEYDNALGALDLLAVRFAEPRWPTLPEPFRRLRVSNPTPVPPPWDPEHGMPAGEREARRSHRVAEEQLALAEACLAWAGGHGIDLSTQSPPLETARGALSAEEVGPAFYPAIDAIWNAIRQQTPRPRGPSTAPAPTSPAADGAENA